MLYLNPQVVIVLPISVPFYLTSVLSIILEHHIVQNNISIIFSYYLLCFHLFVTCGVLSISKLCDKMALEVTILSLNNSYLCQNLTMLEKVKIFSTLTSWLNFESCKGLHSSFNQQGLLNPEMDRITFFYHCYRDISFIF